MTDTISFINSSKTKIRFCYVKVANNNFCFTVSSETDTISYVKVANTNLVLQVLIKLILLTCGSISFLIL